MQPENRGTGVVPPHRQTAAEAASKRRRMARLVKELRISTFVVVVGCVLIIVLLAAWLGFTVPGIKPESGQLNKKEYQAVFLTNGQVYFGKVQSINSNYVVLTNIFYLQSSSASSSSTSSPQPKSGTNNNLTLVKLGVSELHAPEDKMVINQSQVSFWENLKDSSKVVTAIGQYYANPNGSNGQVQSNSSSSTSGH